MTRRVEATAPLRATRQRASDVLRTDPGTVVAEVVTAEERRDRTFHTKLGAEIAAKAAVHHEVRIELGRLHQDADGAVHLDLSWYPTVHQRWFPTFEGEFVATGEHPHESRLVLRGTCRPPFGLLGRFLHRVIGHTIAERSLDRFVRRSANRLDAEVDRRAGAVPRGPAPYPADLRGSERSGRRDPHD